MRLRLLNQFTIATLLETLGGLSLSLNLDRDSKIAHYRAPICLSRHFGKANNAYALLQMSNDVLLCNCSFYTVADCSRFEGTLLQHV